MKDQSSSEELINCSNFIGGEWVDGQGEKIETHSPLDGKAIGEISLPSEDQIKMAIGLAESAQVEWEKVPLKERIQVLLKFRDILKRDMDEISQAESRESGKTFEEGKADLTRAIETFDFALSLDNIDVSGKCDITQGVSGEYRRMAVGVVASITPFHSPALVPMWTIPIALTMGNAYIWKPSERTPLTAMKLANALHEAGLPEGLMTVLHGGEKTVNAIIDAPEVKAISFVGSTKIAKIVYARATSLGKRALCLGGAKNHIILMPDAQPELAGPEISDAFTGHAGQRCMAASVLLAVGEVDRHIEKIIQRAESIKLGSEMGAVISKLQRSILVDAITRAEDLGANVLLDGRKAKPPVGMEGGNWIGPTILDQVQPGSEAATVELMGPVLTIVRCKDIEEALKIQNSSEYGNACSVFTSSEATAEMVIKEAKAGMVGVNEGVPVPKGQFSFGGVASSKFGSGDITGENSIHFWSDLKKITTKWNK